MDEDVDGPVAGMRVRVEAPGDVEAVADVHRTAFPSPDGADEPVEVGLLGALRADEGWIPGLSLVAVAEEAGMDRAGGEVIGHMVCTRGWVEGTGPAWPALGLGPIGVRPERQGAGVGAALMHAVLAAARSRGERLVVLLGSDWYARFGFVPASHLGITAPDEAWGDHFQALDLHASGTPAAPGATSSPGAVGPPAGPLPQGTFRYAAPFTAL